MIFQVIYYRWMQYPGKKGKNLEAYNQTSNDMLENAAEEIELHKSELAARGWELVEQSRYKVLARKDSEDVYGSTIVVWTLYQVLVEYDERDFFDWDSLVLIRDIFGEMLDRRRYDPKAYSGESLSAEEELSIINTCCRLLHDPEYDSCLQFFRNKSNSWAEIIEDEDYELPT